MKNNQLSPPNRSLADWFHAAWVCSSIFVAIPALVAYGLSGKSILEKVLTTMAQPLFATCFFLYCFAIVISRRGETGAARVLFVVTTVLWVVSTPFIENLILKRWESSFANQRIADLEPYDVVVVLGGGTGARPNDDPQLAKAGDRVAFAARLYHMGLAKKLVTTGQVLELTGSLAGSYKPTDNPSVQTKQIWMELGVPEQDIETIGGQNTFSEMQELAKRTEWWESKRCGLITSANHMTRAKKLAERAGVKVEPLAADFRIGPDTNPVTVGAFLPQSAALHNLSNLLKEWIAIQISR